jgi:uncharacterized protein (TIGR02001 family)
MLFFVLKFLWGTRVRKMHNIKVLKNVFFAGIASVILTSGALAADAGGDYVVPTAPEAESAWDIAFGVTFASSYISRGIEFTDGLAVQPWAELTVGMFYLGYWGSNLTPALNGGDTWEHDLSIGIRPELGPVSLDLGYVHYIYTSSGDGGGEVHITGEVSPVEPLTLGAGFWYGVGSLQDSYYTEVNASVDLIENLSASAAVGWIGGSATTPYTTWNAGLTWNPVEPLEIDARYHWAPVSVGGEQKFVISASISSSLSALGFGAPPPPPPPP